MLELWTGAYSQLPRNEPPPAEMFARRPSQFNSD